MFKVNNKDTRTTPRRSGIFIVNFEHVIAGWNFYKINILNSTKKYI